MLDLLSRPAFLHPLTLKCFLQQLGKPVALCVFAVSVQFNTCNQTPLHLLSVPGASHSPGTSVCIERCSTSLRSGGYYGIYVAVFGFFFFFADLCYNDSYDILLLPKAWSTQCSLLFSEGSGIALGGDSITFPSITLSKKEKTLT